jgi:hypothetical protein
MSDFWSTQLASSEPQPELPKADGAAYRAMRRLESASGIYRDPVAPARPQIYEHATPKTLADYGKATSKFGQRQGESDQAFTARLRSVGLQNLAEQLPADELAAVAAAYNAAVERTNSGPGDHDVLRQHLDARQSGTGIGLFGMSAAERGALVQQRPAAMTDLDSRSTPMSPAAMRQAMNEREAAMRGQPPQRQEIPTSSSGSGFIGVDR